MAILPRFYVYVLVRPNGKAFYVGKGQGKRIFAHDTEAKSGHKCHKCNVIRKLWKAGQEYQRYIVFTTDDEQESHDYEKGLIALHGRKNLCNLTDGGEGCSGRVTSDETKAKIGAKHKGKKYSLGLKRTDETRARMSAARKGKAVSPETREKLRQYNLGKKRSPEAIEKKRQNQIGRKMPEGFGVKVSARFKGRIISEEMRQRISQTLKEKAPWKGKEHTAESIQKMKLSKAWPYLVTLPNGEQVEVPHLKTFCEEHNLIYGSLISASNKGRLYRGYIARPLAQKHIVARTRKRRTDL